ncbi:MAG: hypothetical protein Q4G65_08615 [bacterium]|nr:hypothetical protein [bacterium]
MKIGTLLLMTGLIFSAEARPDWTRYVIFPKGADYDVESRSPESFAIRARRTDETVVKTGALAIANVNREMWTHNRLVMNVRSLNGKAVRVVATVSHPNGSGKTVMTSAREMIVAGRAWRPVSLGLDTDFGLGDRNIKIVQVKIGAWVSAWKTGEEGGVEVSGLRFATASEGLASAVHRPGDTFVSIPSKPLRSPVCGANALRVFFAFDNEDLVDSYSTRHKTFDKQQYAGFREKLLEHLEGQAAVATSLEACDVIVYSRCRPDPQLAREIVAAVTDRGVPLYAAGEIADPEIESILPCTVSHTAPEDLPPRQHVSFVDVRHPLNARGGLSDAAFGIYRSITARPRSRTILQFADGTPALVDGQAGKGRLAYNMVGIGSSLVGGKESPDAFLVRALGWLTGRTLPERRRVLPKPDADGWWDGMGGQTFGRFGWEVGSGLLVESLSSRLAVHNGAAGYEFEVPRTGDAPRKTTFAGDRADALSLGGEVAVEGMPAFRIDASLAYPGVRWDFHCNEVVMRLQNLNAFAYVPAGEGKVLDLSKDEIPVADLREPWMLLYNGSERDTPLMLVLQHRPAQIKVIRQGEAVQGIRWVVQGRAFGMVTPTWLLGAKTCDTSSWTNGIPDSVVARAREWHPRALAYPIRCREMFRLDETKGRVDIRARYESIRTADDWGTVPRTYAPVSPVAWTMKGTLFESEDAIRPTGLVTRFGDLAVKNDASEVRWSLKLFQPDLALLPHVTGYADYDRIANEHFAQGVKFTCGGGVKVDYVKDKQGYAGGRNPNGLTCNMHGNLLGLCRTSANPFIFTEENRRLMRRRLTWRLLEPLETMQHKMVCRWRREPVSGIDYTIYMNSPRDIATVYEPKEYGSTIIYGDSNETVMMILTCLQRLADQMGQADVVKANWDAISRHVPSYTMANDDWCIQASGCLEWGGPGSIDMLNAEFAGMMKLARLAEIAGDESVRAQALYRAARRACPTLARLRMLDYCTRNGLVDNPSELRASTGYNESGAVFQSRVRPVQDIDLFDMSQGIPQDLISLYNWSGWTELRRDYLVEVRKANESKGLDYITAAILAIGDDLPPSELESRLARCAAHGKLNARLKKDWPGMDTGSYLEYVLHRLTPSPVITDCRDVDLHGATYDAATKTLTLDFTPGPQAALAVEGKPVSFPRNGERVQCKVVCGER